jgi:HAD superfamily hydrolase (TIGR01549 family)
MTSSPYLVFDAYGTLLELDDFYGRLHRAFAARQIKVPPELLVPAAREEMQHYMTRAGSARDEASWLSLRAECAKVLMDALGRRGLQQRLDGHEAVNVLAEAVAFHSFDDCVETLEELEERGVAMGVASNWDYGLAPILSEQGLSPYFDFALSSATIGCEKPSAQFFDIVRRRVLAIRPHTDTIYYVGDHYDKDMVPARAAGFVPIWLVRSNRDVASGPLPIETRDVTQIDGLTGLLALFA